MAAERLSVITFLRALAAITIVWHHYASYPPLSDWVAPLVGGVMDWLQQHARTTQVFFVIGGYVLARSLSREQWTLRQVNAFVLSRYLRLGIPYVVLIAVTIPILAFARGWVPDDVVGQPVSMGQFLAHLFFLQGLLGYEHLSAGLWFVCINFQLCLVYVALLWLGDKLGARQIDWCGLVGWGLSIASLFHFNLDDQWDNWFLFFFPYFFFGIVIQRARDGLGFRAEFWLFQCLLMAAMLFEWRWRLGMASLVGLALYLSETGGRTTLPFALTPLRRLGEISYSLFLVHFPVLLLVSALWARLEWNGPVEAAGGLVVAFLASVLVAEVFHRFVELPAAFAGRKARKHLDLFGPRRREALKAG